nr:hypothetical protein [Lysinibacillus endophyticus]
METFKYVDKTDCSEKMENVTVVEFIFLIIRHILNEEFKTIWHF